MITLKKWVYTFFLNEGSSGKQTSSTDDVMNEETRGNIEVVGTFVKIHSTVHHKAWTALYVYWKTISQDIGGSQDRMETETNESNCMISVLHKLPEGDEVKMSWPK